MIAALQKGTFCGLNAEGALLHPVRCNLQCAASWCRSRCTCCDRVRDDDWCTTRRHNWRYCHGCRCRDWLCTASGILNDDRPIGGGRVPCPVNRVVGEDVRRRD